LILKSLCEQHIIPLISGKEFIIIGDFNSDVLEQTNSACEYIEKELHCKQIISKPTHDSGSLLDHVYSNIDALRSGVLECTWSDH